MRNNAALGSEPYKKIKPSTDISTPRTLIRLENSPVPNIPSNYTSEKPQNSKSDHYSHNRNYSSESQRDRRPVDNFRGENNNRNHDHANNMYQNAYKSSSHVGKKHPPPVAANQNPPLDYQSERVYSALIRTTPHIKFNNSLYENTIILVLPSSLFGN